MDENTLTDLKQFISSTVSQQITESESRLNSKIDALEKNIESVRLDLGRKIDHLSNDVAEALSSSNEATEEALKDHELRNTKLDTA